SGPRGMALAAQVAYLRGDPDLGPDTLIVNTLETSRAVMELGGEKVTVSQESTFPRSGESLLTLHMAKPAKVGLLIRVPRWVKVPPLVSEFKITINDEPSFSAGTSLGYAVLGPRGQLRAWKDSDRIRLSYKISARLVLGHFGDTGRAALAWGPFIL